MRKTNTRLRYTGIMAVTTLNRAEVEYRQKAIRDAEASLRLEGLTLTDESRRLAARWVEGELSDDAWLEQLKSLYTVG